MFLQNPAARLQPVHTRHANIHEDDIRFPFANLVQSFLPIHGQIHVDPHLFQHVGQHFPVFGYIVDYQGADPLSGRQPRHLLPALPCPVGHFSQSRGQHQFEGKKRALTLR